MSGTKDYATPVSKSQTKTSSKKNPGGNKPPYALWAITIVLCAGFVAGLTYLSKQQTTSDNITTASHHVKKLETIAKKNKPRFEFYNMLPEMTVGADNKPTQATHHRYIIQVASVKSYRDADKLKARLTLLGFDVNVDKAKIKNQWYYRLHVGPYGSFVMAERDKIRLRHHHFDGIVYKR